MVELQHTRSGQLDLNLLHTFRAVAEHGGITRAARVLGRSQPAISARIQRLEQDLGVPLFERAGRRLQLTPWGREMLRDAVRILDGIHQIVDRARAAQREPGGVLRIGALPTVGVYVLAPLVAELLRMHPSLSIDLRYGLTHPQLDELARGELDAVVSVGALPDRHDLDIKRIRDVRPVLATRADTKPAGGTLRLRDLIDFDLIGFGAVGDPFFDAVWSRLEAEGITARIRLRVAHIQTLKSLVVAGLGASILPHYTAVEPELTTRPIRDLEISQPMWLASRTSSRELPTLAWLRDRLS